MSATIVVSGPGVLQRYYDVLGSGDGYGKGEHLLPLLSDEFTFDGPIAGRVSGGQRFAHGVRGFIETVQRVTVLQVVSTPEGAAVLYDAELPGGVVRFSEFFVFDGDRIAELRIQYDPAAYLAAGGR